MWSGLNDRSREGDYDWVGPSSAYSYENQGWAAGYPVGGAPDCVAMYNDGMRDEDCNNEYDAVCIKQLGGTACADAPCGAGRCINAEAAPGYICDCTRSGFTGDHCDVDVDECATDNGGCAEDCVNMFGQAPTCSCSTPGYTTHDGGATCVADGCGCAHVCTHHIDGSTSCSCRDGYSTSDDGATCVADDCTGSRPCQNGGGCRGTAPNAVCDCDGTGFTGPDCSEDILECETDNGGCAHTCSEGPGAPATCTCLPGFTTTDGGVTCEPSSACPAEFPLEVDGRWCAKLSAGTASWEDAQAACEADGANLITLSSARALEHLLTLTRVRLLCTVTNGACGGGCHLQRVINAVPLLPPVCRV